jgi:hypothetical protein
VRGQIQNGRGEQDDSDAGNHALRITQPRSGLDDNLGLYQFHHAVYQQEQGCDKADDASSPETLLRDASSFIIHLMFL